jgi:hypothetical protein
VNSDHQSVFHKKNISLEIPERRLSDEPSKRTLFTSIFPAPSRIPRTFQVYELELRFPTFWHDRFERAADGELLFTRDQVEQIREKRLQNTSTADKDLEGLSATDAVGLSDLEEENCSQIEKFIVWRRKKEESFPIHSHHQRID